MPFEDGNSFKLAVTQTKKIFTGFTEKGVRFEERCRDV
ncbi:MAG: hypothetical protein OJF51_003832 [Nitrospira sp.]|nr:MAG: hypothetical protein OJF51_003832 [Nitrospira sp.]